MLGPMTLIQAGGGTAPEVDVTSTRVSSPASTGGGGTTFEQHVGAYWLAQLLVGAIPPIAINTTVVEVGFQTERLGLAHGRLLSGWHARWRLTPARRRYS